VRGIDLTITLRIPDPDEPFDMDAVGEQVAAWMGWQYLDGYNVLTPDPPRVSIRAARYRDVDGFSVRSSRGDSIFTHTRSSAEKIKARLRNGERTRMTDYEP
jgi:Lhr-like helicase